MQETEKEIASLSTETQRPQSELSQGLIWLMAIACGLGAANLYYIQPLLALIAHDFAVADSSTGFIATVSQMGYALGLLLIVPLGDSVSRRTLILGSLVVAGLALGAMALSPSIIFLGLASLVMGIATVVPQIIVPFAASLARAEIRGRVVGTIMSGLLIGILLARTVSGFVAAHWGWRAIYWIAVGFMLLLLLVLYLRLPREQPRGKMSYLRLLRSLWGLLVREPVLREVSLFGALSFGAFQLFWVTVTFFLNSFYHFHSDVIGLFGLVGVVGALTASVVGKRADRGSPRVITGVTMSILMLSFALLWVAGQWIWGVILGVILLDMGSQGTHISNQTRIYALPAEMHSRLNTVYMFTYFIGGTLGSALGTAAWSLGRWPAVCALGLGLMLLALSIYALRTKRVKSHLRLEAGGLLHLDSTATQRTFAGALLWLRCPMYQGTLTRCPS